MKNKKLLFSILSVVIFMTSCSITKEISQNTNKVLLAYDTKLHISMSAKDSIAQAIPTCENWQIDRDDFVKMITDFKDKNEIIRQKSTNTGNGFVIGGTILGVGGGIYGLLSGSEPKGAAITSLLTGALTGLVGSLNLQKKAERANTCSDFLNSILLDFQIYWGVARCPKNEDELKIYLKSKDDVIERLKSMKCFGLPATVQ